MFTPSSAFASSGRSDCVFQVGHYPTVQEPHLARVGNGRRGHVQTDEARAPGFRPARVKVPVEMRQHRRRNGRHFAVRVAAAQGVEADREPVQGRVDAVGAADIQDGGRGFAVPAFRGDDLPDDRLGHVGNHVVERAQHRKVSPGVFLDIDIAEVGLRQVDGGIGVVHLGSPPVVPLQVPARGDSGWRRDRILHFSID